MAKPYTNLEQSKRLAEFLPLDSADMFYQYVIPKSSKLKHVPEIGNPSQALEWYNKGYTSFGKEPLSSSEYCLPCWSLAALLEIINKCFRYDVMLRSLRSTFDGFGNHLKNIWCITTGTSEKEPFTEFDIYADNALDAAVNVILKLHEQNLL